MEKLADLTLYPSLPLNARCGQVHAALNIPRNRFPHVMARFALSATRHPDAELAAGCRNRAN